MSNELDRDEAVLTESETTSEEPPLFWVILHNDDFTTMDFVVYVLRTIFHHSEEKSIQLMLQVHMRGSGLAGVYTHEIAETKVQQTTDLARAHEYPLLCTMEEAR